jgi:hypothetical protein
MKQLTSAGFLEVLRRAAEWQLIQGPGTGQLMLTTRDTPEAKPNYFLGPHPWKEDKEDYAAFQAAVEDLIQMRATHDDQSEVDVQMKVQKGKLKEPEDD